MAATSDDDNGAVLLPELLPIIHAFARAHGVAVRCRMRRVARAWYTRDPDVAWQRYHPDLATVWPHHRPLLDALLAQQVLRVIPAPLHIDVSGELFWNLPRRPCCSIKRAQGDPPVYWAHSCIGRAKENSLMFTDLVDALKYMDWK